MADSIPLSLRASGPLACYTRPEFKAERMSYPLITPSAARGLFEAVLWKPAMRWRIEKIRVLSPIVFTSFRRNEVKVGASVPSRALIKSGGEYSQMLIEDRRQQRNSVALRDVDYAIDARIELTEHAGEGDTLTKFVCMFNRRLEKGQHFHQPYLGCREFIADLEPVDEHTPKPIDESRDLGLMLWDMDFVEYRPKPHGKNSVAKKDTHKPSVSWRSPGGTVSGDANAIFFAARMTRGVVDVPLDADAARRSVLRFAASELAKGGVR